MIKNRILSLTALVVVACAAAPALAQPAPSAAPAEGAMPLVWDLTRLFPSDEAWDRERIALAAEIAALRGLKEGFGRDAASMRAALDQMSAANRRLSRLWTYASTQVSTANGERRNLERSALMSSLWGQFSSALAWVDPAIQGLGAAKVAAWQVAEPELQRHATRLRKTLAEASHTLAPEAETALAALTPVLGSFSGTRELLINADIEWPSLTVDGRAERLSDTGYVRLRAHPDRGVRKQAFDSFWKTYGQYENTLGALLAQRVQAGVINAQLRKHPTAVAASLAGVEVPEAVMRKLVAEANKALPTLHRYFRLRQKLLGLPDLHYYDIYPNLVSTTRRYPVAEAAAVTLAAMKPLGDEYQDQLGLALRSRTMHVKPAPGKRSGAYAASVYGQTPFIFLNHNDDFESLVTFAHEWGHGMHSVLAQRAQPYETASYPLFLAEIASTTNEVLLTEHMLAQAASRDERIFILTEVLERLRASFFRQTMFAEFELLAHDAQQRGEALSGKRFTEMYCGLLRKYHGADAGVMAIDPAYCREWAYIPHFHRPFYVYAYATSAAAAQFFGERIARGVPGAREAYLGVLRSGSSVPPHELLQRAGLDLSSATPYEALIQRMNAALDEIEKLLAKG
ncbi:Oligoendopeptidase F [Rubrivivax sp. A210]|uniref:M3 family oligoendopeptidase n=1 Tax=Rubrivivax sp. A210 TaxID=2772301 RepID=UPI00191A3C7C|nr:M3 family oligoendopeptidase [Rubrivivax sp. A210]CAD5374550.1 Oligoendopeptidase F [Rubrivivax sp. A210]